MFGVTVLLSSSLRVFVCLGCMVVCCASVTVFSYLKTGSQFEL